MAVIDLFSKRQKRLRGEVPDVYVYDMLPDTFRNQAVQIIRDMLGHVPTSAYSFHGNADSAPESAYKNICTILCREYGLHSLHNGHCEYRHFEIELFSFFLETEAFEQALDVVELTAKFADKATRNWKYLSEEDFNTRVDSGLQELNIRFREHGLGYQYEDGQIVRIDSDLLHVEAIKPALMLLRTRGYAGPREEFLCAHEHYRHGRYEEALTDALKSFESTMKSICDQKSWTYGNGDTAKRLVSVCLENGLIDEFWQTHISTLRGTLENGIATARNKCGAHGQGATPRMVPPELVSYVLHMTGSTIVFLIESAKSDSR